MRKMQEWPEELDALRAAPKHHTLLFENELVRVLDTRVAPGETVPPHTHCWPSTLFIESWSHCVRRDEKGRVMMDSRVTGAAPAGSALWSSALPPHTLENVGDQELRVISIELKTAG